METLFSILQGGYQVHKYSIYEHKIHSYYLKKNAKRVIISFSTSATVALMYFWSHTPVINISEWCRLATVSALSKDAGISGQTYAHTHTL